MVRDLLSSELIYLKKHDYAEFILVMDGLAIILDKELNIIHVKYIINSRIRTD
ncbi:MAG: hypothetical protein IMY67_01775 [Bacteroidetes bacterium]|nr:hypothetical protein [Bacteroidota bacterium]